MLGALHDCMIMLSYVLQDLKVQVKQPVEGRVLYMVESQDVAFEVGGLNQGKLNHNSLDV